MTSRLPVAIRFALTLLVALFVVAPAGAQVTPPAAPSNLVVTDTPDDNGSSLNLHWDLSRGRARVMLSVIPAAGGAPVVTLPSPPGAQVMAWAPAGDAIDYVQAEIASVIRRELVGQVRGDTFHLSLVRADDSVDIRAFRFNFRLRHRRFHRMCNENRQGGSSCAQTV